MQVIFMGKPKSCPRKNTLAKFMQVKQLSLRHPPSNPGVRCPKPDSIDGQLFKLSVRESVGGGVNLFF